MEDAIVYIDFFEDIHTGNLKYLAIYIYILAYLYCGYTGLPWPCNTFNRYAFEK